MDEAGTDRHWLIAAPALNTLLDRLPAAASRRRLVGMQPLVGERVLRITAELGTERRTFVAKRLSRHRGDRVRRVLCDYLPAVGLTDLSNRFLAGCRAGREAWHLYEDLGPRTLGSTDGVARKERRPNRGFLAHLDSVAAQDLELSVLSVADLHTGFVHHKLTDVCRDQCARLGLDRLGADVREAVRSLAALRPDRLDGQDEWEACRDGLLRRLRTFLDELPDREVLFRRVGGADTVLHGDLGVENIVITPGQPGRRARLIDWDHVGVGPVCYDLSTLLAQLPPVSRQAALDGYLEAAARIFASYPSTLEWNVLFDTVERCRIAETIIWRARCASTDPQWALTELGRRITWLDRLEPLLEVDAGARTSGAVVQQDGRTPASASS